MNRIVSLLVAFSFTSSALAGDTWEDRMVASLQSVDPCADWQLVPLDPTPMTGTEALLVIDTNRDGTTAAKWHNLVLKRGVTRVSDGSVALVSIDPDEIDYDGGVPLPGVEPDEIDYDGSAPIPGVEPEEIGCDGGEPLKGVEPDEIDFLLKSAPAYVVLHSVRVGKRVETHVDSAIVAFGLLE